MRRRKAWFSPYQDRRRSGGSLRRAGASMGNEPGPRVFFGELMKARQLLATTRSGEQASPQTKRVSTAIAAQKRTHSTRSFLGIAMGAEPFHCIAQSFAGRSLRQAQFTNCLGRAEEHFVFGHPHP